MGENFHEFHSHSIPGDWYVVVAFNLLTSNVLYIQVFEFFPDDIIIAAAGDDL